MEPSEIFRILEPQYFGSDMHEAREIEGLPNLLGNTRLFIDVGASLGQYTFFANRALENATIVAVEADPIRYTRLAELVDQWRIGSSNRLFAVHAAITDQPGTAAFYTTQSNESGSLVDLEKSGRQLARTLQPIRVPAMTLDDLIHRYAERNEGGVVKVDIEGGEHRLLLGAAETLASRRPVFLLEIHSWGDPSLSVGPAETMQLLRDRMYDYRRYYSHFVYRPVNTRFGLYYGSSARSLAKAASRATRWFARGSHPNTKDQV